MVRQRWFAEVWSELARIDLEFGEVGLDLLPSFFGNDFSQSRIRSSEGVHHTRDIPGVRQVSVLKSAQRNADVTEIQLWTFKDAPVEESGGQIREQAVASRPRENQHLGSDRGDGEAADALLAQNRPGALAGDLPPTDVGPALLTGFPSQSSASAR